MDFLKRHYEKLVLALALIVLIGAAAYLAMKVNAFTKLVQAPIAQPPRGTGVKPIQTKTYEDALALLDKPPLWTHSATGMFGIVAYTPQPTTGPVIVIDVGPDLALLRIERQAFRLLFQAYSGDAKDARNFQINSLARRRTYFVDKVGDTIPDPANPYTIAKFTHRTITEKVAGIGEREKDVSELTLTREGEEPVVLVLNRIVEPNPAAVLKCRAITDEIRVKRGNTFQCVGITYKVVDIGPTQVLLSKPDGSKVTLSLPTAQ